MDRPAIRIGGRGENLLYMAMLAQPTSTSTRAIARAIDEARHPDGSPRAHWRAVLEALDGVDLTALAEQADAYAMRAEVRFGEGANEAAFRLDPVPRVIAAVEWDLLAAGLEQRARALDAFLADMYSEQRIVDAGVMPPWITDAPMVEPDLLGFPHATRARIAGFDIVRSADGELLVLEDNLRTPSGAAYSVAARSIVQSLLPGAPAGSPELGAALGELLRASLDAARPPANPDGATVLLSDGRRNSAWWEHRELAGMLDIPLVAQEQIECRGSQVRAVLDDGTITEVSVIYRRTDLSRLRSADGNLTWLGEALLRPLREGTVACVNGFGTGFGDDKLSHAYVEDMVRFYLGEEPTVRSVRTYDPRDPAQRPAALERVDELVVKPRDGLGGDGVIVCAHAEPEDRERARSLLLHQPERVIAQEMVALSTCPTICGGRLEPRHVDLRAFVYWTAEGPRALPGGLTRVALDRGTLVVNSSQNGGAKDTWVSA